MQISWNAILIKWWRVQISEVRCHLKQQKKTLQRRAVFEKSEKKNLSCTKSEEIEGYRLLFASCQHNSFTFLSFTSLLFNTPHFACDFLFPLVPPPLFLYGEGGDPESIPVLCMGLPDNLGNDSTWSLNARAHTHNKHTFTNAEELSNYAYIGFAPNLALVLLEQLTNSGAHKPPSDKRTTDGGITWCHISTAALF